MHCQFIRRFVVLFAVASSIPLSPAQAGDVAKSEVAQLCRFAPQDSAVFVVARPQQLDSSALWQQLKQIQPVINNALITPSEVDFIAAALTPELAFDPYFPAEQQRQFEELAAQLTADDIDVEPETDPEPQPMARFAVLVRFTRAIDSQRFANLLAHRSARLP